MKVESRRSCWLELFYVSDLLQNILDDDDEKLLLIMNFDRHQNYLLIYHVSVLLLMEIYYLYNNNAKLLLLLYLLYPLIIDVGGAAFYIILQTSEYQLIIRIYKCILLFNKLIESFSEFNLLRRAFELFLRNFFSFCFRNNSENVHENNNKC